MKKLWMIAGSALVMSACSDNVAEMNPAPAGNNNFVTLAEISASLPATRAYLEDVEFGAGKEVKTFWSSGDCITYRLERAGAGEAAAVPSEIRSGYSECGFRSCG